MSRKPLIRTSEFPYHVMSRTNNKEWFQLPIEICWKIFEDKLALVSEKYKAIISSFVLMSNHFHMLIWTPDENIDLIMNVLLREVAIKINDFAGRSNHVFGGRYQRCLVDDEMYLGQVYKYIYTNPVYSNLSTKVEEYPFSTLQYVLHERKLKFPVNEERVVIQRCIPEDWKLRLEWLNDEYHPKQRDVIRNALKRKRFQLSKNNNDQKWIKSLKKHLVPIKKIS